MEHPLEHLTGAGHEHSARKIQKYLRYQLFFKLGNKSSSGKILEQLRKVNWKDREATTASFAYRCLTSAWKVKYANIQTLAGLVAELSVHQDFDSQHIAKAVVGDMHWCLEFPDSPLKRKLSMAKYLGELFNHGVVESSIIFMVDLHLVITFWISFTIAFPIAGSVRAHFLQCEL